MDGLKRSRRPACDWPSLVTAALVAGATAAALMQLAMHTVVTW